MSIDLARIARTLDILHQGTGQKIDEKDIEKLEDLIKNFDKVEINRQNIKTWTIITSAISRFREALQKESARNMIATLNLPKSLTEDGNLQRFQEDINEQMKKVTGTEKAEG